MNNHNDENFRCEDDYLELSLFGENRKVNKIRLCGQKKPEKFITMSQKVDILFHSSFKRRYPGFEAKYKFTLEGNIKFSNANSL